MTESQLQARRERIQKTARIGVVSLAVVLAFGAMAPLIIAGVQAAAAFGIAAVAGLAGVQVAPLVAFKFANWRLRAIKAEASKHPIETLQNEYGERSNALLRFREKIETFAGAVMNFEDKLGGFKEAFPKDAPKFESQLAKMKQLLQVRRRKFKEAGKALELFDMEIQRAKAIWEMGQEAAKLNAAAGMTEEDFLAKIKVETAIDSVNVSMNTAFAELETSLLEEQDEQAMLGQAQVVANALPPHQPQPQVVDADYEVINARRK